MRLARIRALDLRTSTVRVAERLGLIDLRDRRTWPVPEGPAVYQFCTRVDPPEDLWLEVI